jgi:hypothetical protein
VHPTLVSFRYGSRCTLDAHHVLLCWPATALARLRKSGLDTAAITALCSFIADSLVLSHFQLNDVSLTTYVHAVHFLVVERCVRFTRSLITH